MIDPAKYDITIQQGATFSKQFQLKTSDGQPLNMGGYSVDAELWTEGKGIKLADFAVAWVDRAVGKFTLSIPATATVDIGQNGYWDLLVTNPDGTKDYWLRGAAKLVTGYTS